MWFPFLIGTPIRQRECGGFRARGQRARPALALQPIQKPCERLAVPTGRRDASPVPMRCKRGRRGPGAREKAGRGSAPVWAEAPMKKGVSSDVDSNR
jgi:hypothetical protein